MGVTVLFGGTFNPFHIGHYQMLSALCALPQAEQVLVMPDRIPPHKECDDLAPDADRIRMCELAAADFAKAQVCLIEFEREGRSYTYDTVSELKRRFPDRRFAMACGGDMIASLDRWHRWRELIREIPFFAFRRAGEDGFAESVARMREQGAEITVLRTSIPAVSSTELRGLIRTGGASGLLPLAIENYIKDRNLYHGA